MTRREAGSERLVDLLVLRVRALMVAFAVVWVAAWLLVAATVAQADPPVCPDLSAVTAYAGTDDAASELRSLRLEANAGCQVARADAATLATKLDQLHVDLTVVGGVPVVLAGNAAENRVFVATDNGEQLTAVQDSTDASGAALKEGLWFLAGLAAALFAAYAIYRQVMPRG
jgi:hypothetical protein